MTKVFSIGLVLVTSAVLLFNRLSPSDEQLVLSRLEEITDFLSQSDSLPAVRAVLASKKKAQLISEDFELQFAENSRNFRISGKREVIQKLALAKMKLKDFETSSFDTEVSIQGEKAVINTLVRGRGQIVGVMENFSEVREFQIEYRRDSEDKNKWILSNIKNIETENP
ncbi:MAG: hypothetical protein HN509_15420 [Halobacteriovoraceae bacterium]|jgi:hypothetical protein|nr:hypothetical protein [Halobacteriovoraceae bacterium]